MFRSIPLIAVLAVVVVAVALLAWLFGGSEEGETTVVSPPVVTPGLDPEAGTMTDPATADAEDELATDGPEPERGEITDYGSTNLELEVLRFDGAAAAGARVAVFRGDEVLSTGTTNEWGTARVFTESSECELAVFTEAAPLLRRPLESPGPRLTVTLQRGTEVSGWIVVDGRAPGKEVNLTFRPKTVWIDRATIPDSVWDALATKPTATRKTRAATDGSFRFGGLPDSWPGARLSTPGEYHALNEAPGARRSGWPLTDRDTEVKGPVVGAVFEYTRAVRLHGRVVRGDTGEPVPDACISIMGEFPDGRGSRGTSRRANDEGRFEVLLQPPVHVDRLSLTVATALRAGATELDLPPPAPDPEGIWDLGDVPLRPFLGLNVLVLNEDDEAVEGAVVTAPEAEAHFLARSSEPTDEMGTTTFDLEPGATKLLVSAPGYHPQEVTIGPSPPDPLVVTVTGGTELIITVTRENEPLPDGLEVEITSKEPLFSSTNSWMPGDGNLTAAGGSRGTQVDQDGGRLRIRPNQDGRVGMSGVRPGMPMTIRVIDPFGFPVVEREASPLSEGERRKVEIEISLRLRTFRGVVVGPDGSPVSEAAIEISDLDHRRGGARTTERDGSFEFDCALPDRVLLQVAARGFAPLVEPDYPIPADGVAVELRLAEARTVRVSVVDEDGNPIEAGRVEAKVEGVQFWFGARSVGPGVHEIADLPLGEAELQLSLGGRTFRQAHDVSVPEARFVVPRPGSIELVVEGLEIEDEIDVRLVTVQIRGLDDETIRLESWLDPKKGPPWTIRFPAVFPGRYEATVRDTKDLTTPIPLTVPAGGQEARATIRF